jgi:hypothetical protein
VDDCLHWIGLKNQAAVVRVATTGGLDRRADSTEGEISSISRY